MIKSSARFAKKKNLIGYFTDQESSTYVTKIMWRQKGLISWNKSKCHCDEDKIVLTKISIRFCFPIKLILLQFGLFPTNKKKYFNFHQSFYSIENTINFLYQLLFFNLHFILHIFYIFFHLSPENYWKNKIKIKNKMLPEFEFQI